MPYILHVTVIITVCFLFYKLLLQKETFYQLNRWTLLTCLAVSFILPFLPAPRGWSWRGTYEQTLAGLLQTHSGGNPAQADENSNPGQSSVSGDPSPGMNSFVLPSPQLPLGTTEQTTPVTKHWKAAEAPETDASTGVHPESAAPTPVSAIATPATPIPATKTSQTSAPAMALPAPATTTSALATAALLLLHGLFYCYLFGLLLFGANFLLQIAVLCYQSYTRPVIRDGRFRIVETIGNRAPCSFGNNIFINPALYDEDTYQQILIHEKIHVSGRHTLDILLAELAVVLQWFNPFVWLYRREVENNLEFLTDQSVLLHRNVERSAYQLSLLRVSAPHLPFSITNNYNQSLLKRRIVMMNSKRSSRHTIWKYFFLLPILTVLVCTLNKPAAFGQAPAAASNPSGNNGATNTAKTTHRHSAVTGTATTAATTATTDVTATTATTAANPDTTARPAAHPANNPVAEAAMTVDIATPVVVATATPGTAAATTSTVSVHVQPAVSANADAAPVLSGLGRMHVSSHGDGNFDLKEGSWFVTTEGDRMNFELKSGEGDDDNNWQSSFTVDKSEINPFPGQGTIEFKLVRETGTMVFKGQFDGKQGFGHFQFTPDETWFNAAKQLGVEDLEAHNKGTFFILNIKKDYIGMLQRSGYTPLPAHQVVSMSAMHIDEDFLKYWKGSGFEGVDQVHNLITLKAMHIDRAYVDDLKAAGYDHLAIHQLVSFKAQHIDGRYVRSMGVGTSGSPITPEELISFKATQVDSAYLASLRKLGYDHLGRGEIMSLHSMHVTADYIKGFQDAGFKDIPAHTLVSLKSMGITAEYAKGFRDLGYTDLEPNRLVSLKAMGITPEYILEFKKIGYDNIPVGLLTSLKATGVNAEYVSKMKEKGLDSRDLNKYMQLKREFN